MAGIEYKVTLGPALRDWAGVIRHALERAGQGFTEEVRRYPPARGRPWDRRGRGVANEARAVVEGNTVEFGGPEHLTYLLFGTGLHVLPGYGSPHRIVPKSGKVMAWPITGAKNIGSLGVKTSAMGLSYGKSGGHLASRDVGTMFVRSTQGSIWGGKLELVKARAQRAFVAGLKEGVEG